MPTPPHLRRTLASLSLTVKSKPGPIPNPSCSYNLVVHTGSDSSRLNSSGSDESSLGGRRKDDDVVFGGGVREHMDYVDFSGEIAFKELARAILRFGEIFIRGLRVQNSNI